MTDFAQAEQRLSALLLSPFAATDAQTLLARLCEALAEEGVPVWRVATSLPTLHPEVFVRNIVWKRGEGVTSIDRPHDAEQHPRFAGGPIDRVMKGEGPLRHRLGPGAEVPHASLSEIASQGATDYVIHPLVFSTGHRNFVSFATDAAGGFSETAQELLAALTPALALRLELFSSYYATHSLMRVYLGESAARRVAAGEVRRGEGTKLRAAIWYCDLRGFTTLVEERPTAEAVRLLDRYFDCAAEAVLANGGDILKFVGDAVLAIFPVDRHGDRVACDAALRAAESALGYLKVAGRDLRMGIGLHLGEVLYGNVGGRRRLDFTAIGPAVNEVCRIEELSNSLEAPLLVTAAFARASSEQDFVSLGRFTLRQVAEPQEVLTLKRFAKA